MACNYRRYDIRFCFFWGEELDEMVQGYTALHAQPSYLRHPAISIALLSFLH